MESRCFPVFVDLKTAREHNLTEAEGRPESADGREGVYVGMSAPVTLYQLSDRDGLTDVMWADLITNRNRQVIQDAKNLKRADVKNGGTLSLSAQRERLMCEMSDENAIESGRKIAELSRKIAAAKAARDAKKGKKVD